MFRPQSNQSASKAGTGNSPNKQNANISNNTGDNTQSTIRELRSRTIGPTTNASASARQLLANRRQAMSMERLNGASGMAQTSSSHGATGICSDKEKCSPTSGSSNSINGSTTSSPSRSSSTGGLNRTASRVSRFRSAKAVFERLSSANSNTTNNQSSSYKAKPDRPPPPEKPRGTVASRYAAAAAARAAAAQQQLTSSPRSRVATNRFSTSANSPSKQDTNQSNQPKPQPRVIQSSRKTITTTHATTNHSPANVAMSLDNESKSKPLITNVTTATGSSSQPAPTTAPITTTNSSTTQAKPPPKDLIDKIVLEIARDAGTDPLNPDCTIQDLSDCNISGIPETLDFDRCFQDVEMMTEEEARKLLSRKSTDHQDHPALESGEQVDGVNTRTMDHDGHDDIAQVNTDDSTALPSYRQKSSTSDQSPPIVETSSRTEQSSMADTSDSLIPPAMIPKCKVRFSDEPVQVYDTHAVEDYDRRNNDIDPITASAEYELEKSKERAGIRDDSDDDDEQDSCETNGDQSGAVKLSERFNQYTTSDEEQLNNLGAHDASPQGILLRTAPALRSESSHDSSDDKSSSIVEQKDSPTYKKDYVESLERELGLKRILEQNLRDLQSQYYEAVRELDVYKGTTETKISDLEQEVSTLNDRYENAQNELNDAREQSSQFEKQLNDIKESSQLLEKKYHRAKRIIKDMQLREESFTRREQLYQQKLDEIEYELGVLINSIDRTIFDDGLKFFTITDSLGCQRQHQTKLDAFALIKQMLTNFNANKSTQNAQIKQRVVAILEQQLASLMASNMTTGGTCVSGAVQPILPTSITGATTTTMMDSRHGQMVSSTSDDIDIMQANNKMTTIDNTGSGRNTHSYASHRLSQPNMPHPIGVGGQPTKLFHGLAPMPINASLNEPSPPQSVNSYPSSNSLNSLNNNNINNVNNNSISQTNNNNVIGATKLRDHQSSDLNPITLLPTANAATTKDDSSQLQSMPDVQVPYQTDEWHDKPVSEWTVTQVSTWLLALGLDQYISKFEDRNVNGQSLINLDSTVLKGLGVLNSGDRNLLKKKIRELRVEMEKERKQVEKKMKENMKHDKSKQLPSQTNNGNNNNKSSWKKGLLS